MYLLSSLRGDLLTPMEASDDPEKLKASIEEFLNELLVMDEEDEDIVLTWTEISPRYWFCEPGGAVDKYEIRYVPTV